MSEAPPAAAPHGRCLPPAVTADAPGLSAPLSAITLSPSPASGHHTWAAACSCSGGQPAPTRLPLSSLPFRPGSHHRQEPSASLARSRDLQVHNTTPAWRRRPARVSRAAPTLRSGASPPPSLSPLHYSAKVSLAALEQRRSGSNQRRRLSEPPPGVSSPPGGAAAVPAAHY